MIFRQSLGDVEKYSYFCLWNFPSSCHFSDEVLNNSSDDRREEESRKHKVDVTEILRFALDDI